MTDEICPYCGQAILPGDDGTIADLYLTNRVFNCLLNARISTIEQLTSYQPEQLMQIKNFGAVCLQELRNALRRKGLRLKDDREPEG